MSSSKFATQWCLKIKNEKHCSYGSKCNFAHCVGDFNPKTYKKVLCNRGIDCPHGRRWCLYLHDGEECERKSQRNERKPHRNERTTSERKPQRNERTSEKNSQRISSQKYQKSKEICMYGHRCVNDKCKRIHIDNRKTEMCRNILERNECPRLLEGKNCDFAHNEAELREPSIFSKNATVDSSSNEDSEEEKQNNGCDADDE